ncbi:pleckstrin homology domain-containing family A member 2 [Eudromia elegans]
MPYLDRHNRLCGFLDLEEHESCGRFLRRYFILDTQANCLRWYMDNPQNLAAGASAVGSLQLTYISKVSVATPKQKPKTPFCFVINALSQRYFLQASDQNDLQDWVEALNRASKITVPKGGGAAPAAAVVASPPAARAHERKPRAAYKTEIVGGVVVHTPISVPPNGGDGAAGGEAGAHPVLRRSQSYVPTSQPPAGPPALKSGYCVKQGNVRKSWKRRYFVLDEFSISYFKCEQDKEPLRSILLKDVCKAHECLVKSGDLLMRDNLFEIITSSRTFYIQADSPQDMRSWIGAISAAVQALRTRPRRTGFAPRRQRLRPCNGAGAASLQVSFTRSASVVKPSGSGLSSSSGPSLSPARPPEERKALGAPPSAWQPWTPVPQAASAAGPLQEPAFLPAAGAGAHGQRARHRSEPQRAKEKPFAFDLDDESIRSSDV